MTKRVIWTVPPERAIMDDAFRAFLDIAWHAGKHGFERMNAPYQRVDVSRNNIVRGFLKETTNDDDTLIMLDADHIHPPDILERLVSHNVGVVAALAFKRGAPYDPCFFFRGPDGQLHHPTEWSPDVTLLPCAITGTGAIAIQRWVFKALDEDGFPWPYFQCMYPDVKGPEDYETYAHPSDDMSFGLACEHAGIPHHVDVTLVTPHLSMSVSDRQTWEAYKVDHPPKEFEFPVQMEMVGAK